MNKSDAKKIAKHRLLDAEVLFDKKRYAGAVYICGYAIELFLKYKICHRLNWPSYPPNDSFEKYKSFKTHNLDILLSLTGLEQRVKQTYFPEWSLVVQWDPETRYNSTDKITRASARSIIEAARTLLKKL